MSAKNSPKPILWAGKVKALITTSPINICITKTPPGR